MFLIPGGAFEGVEDQVSPFGYGRGEGVDAGHGDPEWICSKEKPQYDQIFNSLNPIDGKVTGAGTTPTRHSRALATLPTHPRGTSTLHSVLQTLLSATQNCSQLTALCMHLKTNQVDENDDSFNKIADVLSIAAQNCTNISQFLVNESNVHASSGSNVSRSISIHSLHELTNEGSNEDSGVFSGSTRESLNQDDASYNDSTPDDFNNYNLNENIPLQTPSIFTVFAPIVFSVKFFFLLFLNLVSIAIVSQVLFVSLAYVGTGEKYIEFTVPKSPDTWLDKARALAYGLDGEVVRITNVFQLFHHYNIINILKYIISKLEIGDL